MVESTIFGTLSDGRGVRLFTLGLGGIRLSVCEFGAAWTSLAVPSKKGVDDVLLGFPTLEGYIQNPPGFGITVGRFANRIGGAKFALAGKTCRLYANDGANTLHGGRVGFSKKLWKGEAFTDKGGASVRFTLESPDCDEGYPGNLKAAVTYRVTENAEIVCLYEAEVDAPCPVNFTNHAYFNLQGEGKGGILGTELKLNSSRYVEPDAALIPTGKLLEVAGTPFDFRNFKTIGKDFAAACGGDVDAVGTGYDHCFALDGFDAAQAADNKKMLQCAEARDAASGRGFTLATIQPGVQFYSGNFLTGIAGKAGSVYGKNAGFCLETQHFPDSPNRPEFPDAIFGPGRAYSEKSVFKFSW